MKITKSQLKQIIKEELKNLNEDAFFRDSALKHLAIFVENKINRTAGTFSKIPREEIQAAYAAALKKLAEDLETIRGWGSPL